jgi:hypothetical protein
MAMSMTFAAALVNTVPRRFALRGRAAWRWPVGA